MHFKQQRSDVIRNSNTYNLGAMHPFLKHFKITSFPDRVPSLPKHHRHKREDHINNHVEKRLRRDETVLNKLNYINEMLQQRSAQMGESQNTTNILDRVLNEVHDMKSEPGAKHIDCNMQAQWVSEAAGGIFDLANAEISTKDVRIPHKKAHDKGHYGFMNSKDWNTTVKFPFANNSQYIIVTALNIRDKLIATFMGECRFCRKREILQGNWLIVSHSRDCESIGTTAKLVGDVWRHDNIETLRMHHLSMLKKTKLNHEHKEQDKEDEDGSKMKNHKPESTNEHAPSGMPQQHTTTDHTSTKKSKKNTMLYIKLH